MKRTDTAKRYGRRALPKEETNAALPAVPAARTKGSTGRQQVAAARTLPTAESPAASPPLEADFAAVRIGAVFMGLAPGACDRITSRVSDVCHLLHSTYLVHSEAPR